MFQKKLYIPNSRLKKIKSDYEQIKTEFETYAKGFIKAAKKKRNDKDPLYKESSLINFISDIVQWNVNNGHWLQYGSKKSESHYF